MNDQNIRVIIADDEQHICNLLQALIDWDRLGMTLAAFASNGIEAMEKLREMQPDILITDIRMPGCTGLELIKQAKEVLPFLQILIVSGYAHFEYAKQAIQYGVGDYLLKPVNRQELNDTLDRMAGKCRMTRRVESSILSMDQSSRDDIIKLRRSLLIELIEKKNFTLKMSDLNSVYHFKLGRGVFLSLELKIDTDEDEVNNNTRRVLYEKAQQSFGTMLSTACIDHLIVFRQMAGFALIHYEKDKSGTVRKALRDILHQTEEQARALGSFYYTMALSREIESADMIPDAFNELADITAERLVRGTGVIIDGVLPQGSADIGDLLEHYTLLVDREMRSMSIELADEAVNSLEHEILSKGRMKGADILSTVITAGCTFIARIEKQPAKSAEEDFTEACMVCHDVSKLFEALRRLHHRLLGERLSEMENESARPIRLAKKFVCDHFAEQITLEDVCRVTGFSVSYFSAMFKKENGEGFTRYLTHVRMEEAKTLLRETNTSVAVIGEKVGYLDRKYFTQTFHRTVGINPGEYRKLYG